MGTWKARLQYVWAMEIRDHSLFSTRRLVCSYLCCLQSCLHNLLLSRNPDALEFRFASCSALHCKAQSNFQISMLLVAATISVRVGRTKDLSPRSA
mmetsp:Transcript_8756/g.15061  ORF Transcript_8756/g.15061 Transcript_8756/m.15061 type:complete len:96 (+) Transcript_8756:470-757(+)